MTLSYHGRAKVFLEEIGAEDFSVVLVKTRNNVFKGVLLPRPLTEDDKHIVLKLNNGYNIGVRIDKVEEIKPLGQKARKVISPSEIIKAEEYADVSIIGTGGTIASRVDYVSGAVYPQFSASELLSRYPEVEKIGKIKTVPLLNIFSEDMRPTYWRKIAESVARELNSGVKGVVITHGTDTMHFTSAALSFMLRNLTGPVVLTGAQRSPDRGSTDAYLNFLSAVKVAAQSDLGEVVIVMHQTPSDTYCAIHRGTKVRKMHTSRRDAFLSVNSHILGIVNLKEMIMFSSYSRKASEGEVEVNTKLEEKVALIYAYPGVDPDVIDFYVDKGYRGLVVAGTGLGHTPEYIMKSLKRALENDVTIVVTSQCLFGRVNMKVYRRGRELLKIGVIPGEDMLPEVAYVKLMFALGNYTEKSEVTGFMRRNIAGELTSSLSLRLFPPTNQIYQGV